MSVRVKLIRAVGFQCPDCAVLPKIEGAGITRDGRVYIVGVCPDCGDGIAVDIERIIIDLSGGQGNGKAN